MERRDAIHLVRRTGFGVDYPLVDQLVGMSRSAAVGHLMNFGPNPPFNPPAKIGDPDESRWKAVHDLYLAWLERMRTVPRPLEEKLVLFWHSHFAVHASTVRAHWSTYEENMAIRASMLGKFRPFVHTMSKLPSMLQYLDNYRNKAGKENENFARELLELHMLGPGEHHTEMDVLEAARAWTGHHVTEDYRSYQFNAYWHDYRNKTIFGMTRNWDGPEVIDEALQGTHRTTSARYIARKMWSFFAYPDPEESVVDDIVGPYLASDLGLDSLVQAVLNHDRFYSDAARNALVRSPVEWTISCLRGASSPVDESNPEWWLDDMGQILFYPPSPAGWGQNDVWISSTASWTKADFAGRVARKAESRDYLGDLTSMSVPAAVSIVIAHFGLDPVTPTTRRALEDYMYAERADDGWPQYRNLLNLVMLSPEMQLA